MKHGLVRSVQGSAPWQGFFGAWLTDYLTSKPSRRNAVTKATSELIAKSPPSVMMNSRYAGVLDNKQIADQLLSWSEETMCIRARLATLTPDMFSLCDFLWQRSSDQMMALIKGDMLTGISPTSEIQSIIIKPEKSLVRETSGRCMNLALSWLNSF